MSAPMNAATNAGGHADTYAGTNPGPHPGTNAGTNAGANAAGNAGTDAGSNAGINAGAHVAVRVPAPTRGVVLAELLVALAVMAVLLTIALPDYGALVRRQQLRTAVADLSGALALARAQALARAGRVELVPLDAGGSDWSRGWVVLVDRDGDRRPGAGDERIAVHGPLPAGMVLSTVFSSHQQPDYIAFNSGGRGCTADSALAARFGTLTLRAGAEQRRVIINMLGRIRVCDPVRDGDSCGDGAP